MSTLVDNPEFTADEIYEIAQNDPVEGAAVGASYGGIGVSNQPHQQLANRTAFLKQRQDANIASLGVLQAFMAGFTGSLQTNGYLEIPVLDAQRGQLAAILQWGFVSLPGVGISNDAEYPVNWPIRFPNAILIPPLAANLYQKTSGLNLVVSPVSYSTTGGIFVYDIPGGAAPGPWKEITNGFSWIAIGF